MSHVLLNLQRTINSLQLHQPLLSFNAAAASTAFQRKKLTAHYQVRAKGSKERETQLEGGMIVAS